MQRLLLLFLFILSSLAISKAEEPVLGVDLVFPELAHPREDALAAIRRSDFRFITIDWTMKVVPGVEKYPRTVRHYGTKFMKQPLHLFTSRSRSFSYNIRVRAYASEYNKVILQSVLERKRRGEG